MSISQKDRQTLRELGRKVAEVAADPVQARKAAMWTRHNDLQPERPLVLVFPEGSWREMLPREAMTCAPGLAQDYEYDLRVRLYYWEHLRDDNVIEAAVYTPVIVHNTGWGVEDERQNPDDPLGAHRFEPVLNTEADIDRLQIPQITVDWPATRARQAMLEEVFDGVLPVVVQGPAGYGLAPLDHYAKLRGIDQMFMDLVDNPEMVHKAIGKLVDGHRAIIRAYEREGILSLPNGHHYTGSGGNAFTKQLPSAGFDGTRVRPMDQWGFATAQIFSEVSPAMHEEFALQHEKRVLELFGLNCYGCCEPLHHKLDIIKTIPRLRRVSIAPWADVDASAESLGDRYIFSWKPNPAVVAGEGWDPEAVRQGLRDFLQRTRGCVVEMILKDTHTCRRQPHRIHEWVRIAVEEAEAFDGG
ncbi:MAG: uroporphyrinogen decarboxylase/cobalamine-independent methonine synthase family protein [Armatimonadota bacterium]